MSVFFAILSIVFYGCCHLLARSSRPTENFSFRDDIVFDGNLEDFSSAIRTWLEIQPDAHLINENKDQILIEHKATWLFFGAYFYFNISESSDHLIVTIAAEPKLISSGNEIIKIVANLRRHFVEIKTAA